MVTYETALILAKSRKHSNDNCTEFSDAYIFGSRVDDNSFGGSGPIVILKSDGTAINMTAYLSETSGGEPLREFAI